MVVGGVEGLKIVRIRISSHMNRHFLLQQSLTAFGGAPFAQGSLSLCHAFGLLHKLKFFDRSVDEGRSFGSCFGGSCLKNYGRLLSQKLWEAVVSKIMGAGSVVCLAYSECKRGAWEKF
jgi:hypothetical protein